MNAAFTMFQCFKAHIAASQTVRASHVHAMHEFIMCTNGNGTQFAGKRAFPQHRGDVFCFPAGMPHYCSGSPRAPARGYVIWLPDFMFAPDVFGDRETHYTLERVIRLARSGCNPLPLGKKTAQDVLLLTGQMVREYSGRRPGYQAATRLLLQNVFLQIMRDPAVGSEPGDRNAATHRDEQIARVFRFIDTHFMEDVSVEQMARLACMSRSHFHAVFREVAGCTLIAYLTQVRIRAAQRLLCETDSPIIQVAMDCGFPSLSRFYDAFKAFAGNTPRASRMYSSSLSHL